VTWPPERLGAPPSAGEIEAVLAALRTGPKATTEIAVPCLSLADGTKAEIACDVAVLHWLWRQKRIAWDWQAQRWKLP